MDMVIRLCGPIGDESHYLQSMERMSGSSSIAVQHMIHHGGGKDDGVSKAMATRILMELLVKDSIVKGKMPSGLAVVANDWKFLAF